MNAKVICSYKIVKMMMCTHTEKKSNSHVIICTDCGLVLDRDIMTTAINNALDMAGQKIAMEILNSKRDYTSICDHINKDIDGGTPFCTKCGLMFEDEVVYASEVHNMDYHHYRTSTETEKKKTEKVDPKPRKVDLKPEGVKTEPKPKEPEIIPKNVKDLVTIAKGRGIRNSTTMSKKKLCEILGLEITKPDKLVFRNKETGEERRFKSIYRASKEMSVNPGLIHHHIGASGVITVDGVAYDVCEI